jgi:hypothetical protein
MLIDRLHEPKNDEILYHYCSSETFSAICEHKTIRLSDVNMMNDYNEAGYGYTIFENAANYILKDKKLQDKFPEMQEEFFDRVDEVVSPMQLRLHPVVACFSKEPDVLSQWRAYGDNGRGFAVGFKASALKALPISLLEVEYDEKKQVQEMVAALCAIVLEERDKKSPAAFKESCALLSAWSLGFKAPAFKEEQEVRALHALDVKIEKDHMRLVDEGGQVNGKDVAGQPVKFRINDGGIIAYIDLKISAEKPEAAIVEVWLGPANQNGPGNVHYLLGGHGMRGTEIKKSTATYR